MSGWQQLVIEGQTDKARGFVHGVLADHGVGADVVHWGTDVDLEHETLRSRLTALLTGHHHEELLLPDAVADDVAHALASGGSDAGLALVARQRVHEASFRFRAEAPAHAARAEIRRSLVESLPAGANVVELDEQERSDPSAHGVELYAPTHEYLYCVRGRIAGDPGAVLTTYRRARDLDFVHLEVPELRTSP